VQPLPRRKPGAPHGTTSLAAAGYQGRRAGLATLDELAREVPAVRGDSNFHAIRADYLLGDGDLAGVRAAVEELTELEPRTAAEHAVSLAWLGDLGGAATLAAGLPAGSMLAVTCAAVVDWQEGRCDAALDGLRAACARTPVLAWRVAPLYLLGELCHRAGRHEEAAEALARFQGFYVWRQMWRSWAWPRAQLLLARSHLELGEPERALGSLYRLQRAWEGAEPGAALLEEARALRAELPGA
jgi:hypothetical protein